MDEALKTDQISKKNNTQRNPKDQNPGIRQRGSVTIKDTLRVDRAVPCSAHVGGGKHDNKPLSSWRPAGAAWLQNRNNETHESWVQNNIKTTQKMDGAMAESKK